MDQVDVGAGEGPATAGLPSWIDPTAGGWSAPLSAGLERAEPGVPAEVSWSDALSALALLVLMWWLASVMAGVVSIAVDGVRGRGISPDFFRYFDVVFVSLFAAAGVLALCRLGRVAAVVAFAGTVEHLWFELVRVPEAVVVLSWASLVGPSLVVATVTGLAVSAAMIRRGAAAQGLGLLGRKGLLLVVVLGAAIEGSRWLLPIDFRSGATDLRWLAWAEMTPVMYAVTLAPLLHRRSKLRPMPRVVAVCTAYVAFSVMFEFAHWLATALVTAMAWRYAALVVSLGTAVLAARVIAPRRAPPVGHWESDPDAVAAYVDAVARDAVAQLGETPIGTTSSARP